MRGRKDRIALGQSRVVGWFALCDGTNGDDPDGEEHVHAHDASHSDETDDADPPSTAGLPMSLAIALFVAGIVLGVITFSCS